jgi:hypothetical protein
MVPDRPSRRPVSTRHAFALAFDLALLRDPVQSMVVPLLLRAPWILAVSLVPYPGAGSPRAPGVLLLWCAATVGGSIASWWVDAMLRFRARSVYNTPHGVPPAPVLECYERGFARLPWLYVTEAVRNLGLFVAFPMLVVPGIWLGYKLAFATEAVVLDDHTLAGAFRHSYHLSRGRLERWLEMVVGSVLLVLGVWFVAALVYAVPRHAPPLRAVLAVFSLALVALLPVFQYAWTFFYLRLTELDPEVERAGGGRVEPFASQDHLPTAGPRA